MRSYVSPAVCLRLNSARRVMPALGAGPIVTADTGGLLRLPTAVTGFLQLLSAVAPVAVLLDDQHWTGSASVELLQHLARRLHGESGSAAGNVTQCGNQTGSPAGDGRRRPGSRTPGCRGGTAPVDA